MGGILRRLTQTGRCTSHVHSVGARVADVMHEINLVGIPHVGTEILGLRDVLANMAMQLRAVNANKHSMWQHTPRWTFRGAVGTFGVARGFQERAKCSYHGPINSGGLGTLGLFFAALGQTLRLQ